MLGKLEQSGVAAAAFTVALSSAQALDGTTTHGATDAVGGSLPEAVEIAATTDLLRTRLERLSEGEVKTFYLHCSGAALRGRLDRGEIAACSVGYDVLLRRHFGGDFHALLAWSRGQPNDLGAAAIGGR